jgi:hypothetical protein
MNGEVLVVGKLPNFQEQSGKLTNFQICQMGNCTFVQFGNFSVKFCEKMARKF